MGARYLAAMNCIDKPLDSSRVISRMLDSKPVSGQSSTMFDKSFLTLQNILLLLDSQLVEMSRQAVKTRSRAPSCLGLGKLLFAFSSY